MYRNILTSLLQWKDHFDRSPLIVRGARQVGKSYSIQEFGKTHYKNLVTVDFERSPSLAEIFSGDIQIGEIIQKLELALNVRISPEDTLLFFDEIQKCPRALMALRYFKEEKPQYHVVAAGSLLDFILQEISIPVGRVSYLHMHPMSFMEFLCAMGENRIASSLEQSLPTTNDVIHRKLLSLVKKYSFIGGMPKAVSNYLKSESLRDVSQVHLDLIESFRQDFSKYSSQSHHPHLLKVMDQIPKKIGQQIKYSHIDPDSRTEEIKKAVNLLERAQIIHRVRATSGAGLPLGAEASEKIFKAVFLDIGLMQTICGINWGTLSDNEDLIKINEGALAEQFVGQELLATTSTHHLVPLYYWKREAHGSSAEVDYVTAHKGEATPIEVKSAATGRLRSLHLYCQTYHPKQAFIVSSHPFQQQDHLTWIPFYGIEHLK